MPSADHAAADHSAFVRNNTTLQAPPLVPEIRLHLAAELTPLWQTSEFYLTESNVEPPFWAFAWAGGQALARWLLDNPDAVAGKHVLDVGAGSGRVAIAAAMAGASRVEAVDLDPVAAAAIEVNAAANGVAVTAWAGDASLIDPGPFDVILTGDVCYARQEAHALTQWFKTAVLLGHTVLMGDPNRRFLPKRDLAKLADYVVPTPRDLEANDETPASVWRFVLGG